MSLLLQTAKAILHEVDGTNGGYDPNSYIPPHFVQALRAGIDEEQNKQASNRKDTEMNKHVHDIFRTAVNAIIRL